MNLDTALERAALKGDMQAIQEAVKSYGDRTPSFHADIGEALSWAAYEGHLPVVKYLVDVVGADPFGSNHAALHCAQLDGHLEVVAFLEQARAEQKEKFLVEMQAQENLRNWLRRKDPKAGETPLVRAIKMRCFDVVSQKMMTTGDCLTLQDLTMCLEQEAKRNLLEVAEGDMQLAQIFQPGLWRGRLEEMNRAWEKVSNSCKDLHAKMQGFHFASVVSAHRQMTLKENKPKILLKGPKPG